MRKYISLFLFWIIIVMAVTGFVLYIMPHGRVAYWTNWHFLGLDKDQWTALHTIFAFLMIFFAIWHIILNWEALLNYLKSKTSILISKPSLVTIVIVILIAIGTILNLPPFKTVIDLGERIKDSWPKPSVSLPAFYTEFFDIKKMSTLLGLTTEEVLKILNNEGIKVESEEETLKEIAKRNKTSPAHIYQLLLKYSKNQTEVSAGRGTGKGGMGGSVREGGGAGLGRITLKEICSQLEIDPKTCITILQNKGISATLDDRLRNIAGTYGINPVMIVEILKEGKEKIEK